MLLTSPQGREVTYLIDEFEKWCCIWVILPLLRSLSRSVGWQKRVYSRTSLVAHWLRIHLPMQGTWVQSLVQEDPTCHRATKPMCHNYWACILKTASHSYWSHMPQLLKPMHLEPVLCNKRSYHNEKHTQQQRVAPGQLEKAHVQQQRPNAAKNK